MSIVSDLNFRCGGVGHETDFTLLDFVSNIRQKRLPAEIVSEGASKLKDYLDFMSDSLNKKMHICK